METKFIVGGIVILGVVGGYVLMSSGPKPASDIKPMEPAPMVKQEAMAKPEAPTAMKKDDGMMGENKMEEKAQEQGMMKKEEVAMKTSGTYKTYSDEVAMAESKAGRKVVLFFHAAWCPKCQTAEANFLANTDKIPANVSVLKVDYDTSTDMKKKYAVTSQHTFVQIDAKGNQVTKWVSGDVELLANSVK